jgi:hypothetical protein
MGEDVQVLIGVSSRILHISLNGDLARIEEAGLIEESRENQNIFKQAGSEMALLFL